MVVGNSALLFFVCLTGGDGRSNVEVEQRLTTGF